MAAPTLQSFNVFLTQRLTAVAVDVYGYMEKTVLGYQEEVYRTRQENQRLQRLLDLVYKPETGLNGAVSDARQIDFPTSTQDVSTQVEQKVSIPRVAEEEPGILPLKKERGESLTGCVGPAICPQYSDRGNRSLVITVGEHTEDKSRSDERQMDFSTSTQKDSPQVHQKKYVPRVVKEEAGSLAFTEEHVTEARQVNFSTLTPGDPAKVQQKEYISKLAHGELGNLPCKEESSDTWTGCAEQNVASSLTQVVTVGEETEDQLPSVTEARQVNFSTLTPGDPAKVQQKEYISKLAHGELGNLPCKEESSDTWTGCAEQNVASSLTQVVTVGEETEDQLPSVSQDVTVCPVEESRKPAVVKQSTPDPAFQHLQAHWSSSNEGKLQALLQGDAVASCSKYDQRPQSSENRTVANRAVSSIEEIESIEDDDRDSEVVVLWQPDSIDCGDDDASDAEGTAQGVRTVPLKKKTKRRNRPKHIKSLTNNTDVCYPPSDAAPAQTVESSERRGANNVCYVCGKTFTMKANLKRHMFGHTGLKPHGCKECGRTFARIESLRVHMRIHTREIPYTCSFCGKAFRHRGNMICHLRTHTGEKPHRCSICSKAYAYTQDLRKHMQIHAKK